MSQIRDQLKKKYPQYAKLLEKSKRTARIKSHLYNRIAALKEELAEAERMHKPNRDAAIKFFQRHYKEVMR